MRARKEQDAGVHVACNDDVHCTQGAQCAQGTYAHRLGWDAPKRALMCLHAHCAPLPPPAPPDPQRQRLPTAHRPLLTTHCPLPTASCNHRACANVPTWQHMCTYNPLCVVVCVCVFVRVCVCVHLAACRSDGVSHWRRFRHSPCSLQARTVRATRSSPQADWHVLSLRTLFPHS